MRFEFPDKPEKCPRCEHTRIADIHYGLPAYSEKLYVDILNGKIVVEGSKPEEDAAAWQCTKCTLKMHRN